LRALLLLVLLLPLGFREFGLHPDWNRCHGERHCRLRLFMINILVLALGRVPT
jgi:hypothetical protein